MSFRVTLRPSGRSFDVPAGKTVLTAGLEAGLNLAYSCRAGSCTTCRGRILDGKVDYGRSNDHCLTAEQRAQGFALLCQAAPLTDLAIEVHELSLHMQPPKIVPCRVKKIARVSPDVAVVDLRLPYNDNMIFAAGQYVDFILKDGRRRSYSIATAPALDGGMMDIQLHIRHHRGGAFTDHVFGPLRTGEILRFEGPLGTFYLREESDKPIVLLAGSTGFAPIKAIIEYALRRKVTRPMALYWGCRSRQDLYMDELPRSWPIGYVPVLSEPDADWAGRTGFVHRAVIEDIPDLSGHQVYASGSPAMVEAARRDFASCALPDAEFFADSFITEADLAQAATT